LPLGEPELPPGFFVAPLGWLELPDEPLLLGEEPVVPLAPDEPELLPEADVPPLELDPLRSHPANRAPLSANAIAAANAVSFILTSFGLCPLTRAINGP